MGLPSGMLVHNVWVRYLGYRAGQGKGALRIGMKSVLGPGGKERLVCYLIARMLLYLDELMLGDISLLMFMTCQLAFRLGISEYCMFRLSLVIVNQCLRR